MTSRNYLRIGARGSKLSLTQAEWVAARLREQNPGLSVEVVIVQTTGDKLRDISLSVLGGQGVFTKEIERALLDEQVDVAVHSLKDLPTTLPDELELCAITKRESPNDCLVAARTFDLSSTEREWTVGTSSLRRQAQLLKINPQIKITELRGNVPTRIDKMMRGEADAIVLAAAGMARLGISPPWLRELSFEEMLPAPGQGALGIEIRKDDDFARSAVQPLNDKAAWSECMAEREFLRAFGGGCRAPIAALGRATESTLSLDGLIASADATEYFRDQISGPASEATSLGAQLARRLMQRGAAELIESVSRETAPSIPEITTSAAQPLAGKKIVVTRDEDADGPLSSALRNAGAEPLLLPMIQEAPPKDAEPLRRAATQIEQYDWIVFSSVRAVAALHRALAEQGKALKNVPALLACAGPNTAEALRRLCDDERTADAIALPRSAETNQSSASLLAKAMSAGHELHSAKILHPRSEQALPEMRESLLALGAEVDDPVAYRSVPGSGFESVATLVREGRCDAITFASPSSVEFFAEAMGDDHARLIGEKIPTASIGPTTSAALRKHGISVAIETAERTYAGLVAALERFFRT